MFKRLCILLGMFWIMGNCAVAQITKSNTWISAAADTKVPLLNTGVYNQRITWTGKGTRTTCTVKLEQSTTGAFAGEETDLIAGQTCTSNGTYTATGYVNYVRIKVTVLTGAGNTLYVTYQGTNVIQSLSAVNISDGSGNNLTSGAYGGTRALHTVIVDAAGTQITSFGGGTQFVNGAAIGTGTGTIAHGSTTTNAPTYTTGMVTPLSLDTAGNLRVYAPTVGDKTDAKNSATDATSISAMQVLKQISYLLQQPLSVNPGTADAAEGAAPTNPPVPIAVRAYSDDPAVVDTGDVGYIYSDLLRKPVTSPYAIMELWGVGAVNITSTTEVDFAANANYRYCLTSISIYNYSAVDTRVFVYENGSGGTYWFPLAAPAKGGELFVMPSPKCTSATNKKITFDAQATADGIDVKFSYFLVKR